MNLDSKDLALRTASENLRELWEDVEDERIHVFIFEGFWEYEVFGGSTVIGV